MRTILKQYLESKEYYPLFPEDLGGGDHFDCVAVGDTVGCIELKLHSPKKVAEQAYERLYYMNWAVVLMPKKKSLETILKKHDKPHWAGNRKIGLWHCTSEGINIIRDPDIGEPGQHTNHTIKMCREIVRYKKLGVPNEIAWNHKRGISLYGLMHETDTMYGKKRNKNVLPLECFDDEPPKG